MTMCKVFSPPPSLSLSSFFMSPFHSCSKMWGDDATCVHACKNDFMHVVFFFLHYPRNIYYIIAATLNESLPALHRLTLRIADGDRCTGCSIEIADRDRAGEYHYRPDRRGHSRAPEGLLLLGHRLAGPNRKDSSLPCTYWRKHRKLMLDELKKWNKIPIIFLQRKFRIFVHPRSISCNSVGYGKWLKFYLIQ